jgi:hypothetical protein
MQSSRSKRLVRGFLALAVVTVSGPSLITFGDQTSPAGDQRKEIREILERWRSELKSFDVRVKCISKRTFDVAPATAVSSKSARPMHLLTKGQVLAHAQSFNQAMQTSVKGDAPLRRIEELDPASGKQLTLLAYDGVMVRSYDVAHKTGALHPLNEKMQFVHMAFDYSTACGLHVPEDPWRTFVSVVEALPPQKAHLRETADEIQIHLEPFDNVSRKKFGYRIWLSRKRGLCLKRLESYCFAPSFEKSVDPVTTLEIVVDKLHRLDDGLEAPAAATIRMYFPHGDNKGALASEFRIVVDEPRSSWNLPLPKALFTFDWASKMLPGSK